MLARGLNRYSVSNCLDRVKRLYLFVAQCVKHRRSARGLNAVNFNLGAKRLNGKCNAAYKTAATDRNQNRVNIRQLIQNFKTDCSLTRDNHFIVKRVDKCHILFFHKRNSLFVRIVISTLYKANLRAVALCCLHLGYRRIIGDTDKRLDTVFSRRKCNPLCVVSGRAGDNTLCLFFIGQLRYLVICPSYFKRTCDL